MFRVLLLDVVAIKEKRKVTEFISAQENRHATGGWPTRLTPYASPDVLTSHIDRPE